MYYNLQASPNIQHKVSIYLSSHLFKVIPYMYNIEKVKNCFNIILHDFAMAFMLFYATLPLVIYNFSLLSLFHISVMEMYFSIKIYTLTQGRLARITATIIKKKSTQAKALKSIRESEWEDGVWYVLVFIWGDLMFGSGITKASTAA